MLAIVCKSTKYASDLVKHRPNGQINSAFGLHALATKRGLPINKQYLVISLENIRAYEGEISNNHLTKLALPYPILANGSPHPAQRIGITMLIEEKKQILEEITGLLKREREKHGSYRLKFTLTCIFNLLQRGCPFQITNGLSHDRRSTFGIVARLCYDYSHDQECLYEKELVIEQIGRKNGSAAVAIIRILQSLTLVPLEDNNELRDNVIGVVAFLGISQTNDLSRVLANYLGEDQMLTIICESYAFISNLVEYKPDGRVDIHSGLYEMASYFGIPINKNFDFICIDNLRY
ncbi:hypothetical protein M9H77_23211 [Catharanthus roseus]|uniref:Uncharacterized protein n=1 Tax=Catharanthus roseus TaxID=4058 RepID=A0ACC0AVD2_CATRO|nr:hypothetical protein M9H77_23211 [Catharanthus roseus]